MGALKTQFFLCYAVLGSLMPLLGVFLKEEKALSDDQVGLAMSLASVAMLLTPALITLLADTKVDSRRILASACGLSALVLGAMYFSASPLLTIALFLLHGLAFVAMLPLLDGFFFSYAELLSRIPPVAGSSEAMVVPPYPKVRIWGTIGFIVPSLILFAAIELGARTSVIIPCASGFCLLSILNSFRLPFVAHGGLAADEADRAGAAEKPASRLPTREALAVLFSPKARRLCLGLALSFVATSAFYAFLAIYFREEVGIAPSQIGLVLAVGVCLEILWTLAMPWLQKKIRLKGILVAGMLHLGLRLLVLAKYPTLGVVLVAQIGHGLEVLALFVVPAMYLNRLAGDRFRNSIQGVYTMSVAATSRIVGALAAGWLVKVSSLTSMFAWAGLVALTAAVFVAAGMKPIAEEPANSEQ